jgi:hypothetical protein
MPEQLDPECERTGLPMSMCAHCRPAPPRPRADRVIYAAFNGHCAECDGAVRIGDRIGLSDGEWCCDRCVQC